MAAYVHGDRNSPIGINSRLRGSSRYRRRYFNSIDTHHDLHAEASLILKLKKIPDQICVVRFLVDGSPTMARPCAHCQNFLRMVGVKSVRYTDWDGIFQVMNLRS